MADKAIVLLSGGLDSTTCLAEAIAAGFEPVAVSFDYGQRHATELRAAHAVAAHYGCVQHYVFQVGALAQLGGSSLTADLPVRTVTSVGAIPEGIPNTYVPARNTLFLAHALGVAEVHEARAIYIGVNALDHGGYPDCRPEFIAAFEQLANVATAATTEGELRIRLHTPLIEMTKQDIVARALALEVPVELTHTCYRPSPEGVACGACDACVLRLDAFARVGVADPVAYQHLS